MKVEVVYALPDKQSLLSLEVPAGTTVEQAIRQSGILSMYPDIDLANNKVGIFSKPTTLDTELREFDRVEIYRPLIADPKEIRRRKAQQNQAKS
jgi:hypothetical protein